MKTNGIKWSMKTLFLLKKRHQSSRVVSITRAGRTSVVEMYIILNLTCELLYRLKAIPVEVLLDKIGIFFM